MTDEETFARAVALELNQAYGLANAGDVVRALMDRDLITPAQSVAYAAEIVRDFLELRAEDSAEGPSNRLPKPANDN